MPPKSQNRVPAAEIVVVHSSDIHVDDGYTAACHGGDGTFGLKRVLEAARAAAADIVLLAGDVFEHNRLPLALLDRAARLLADSGLSIVMLPGNHDPAMPDSVWRRGGIAEPPNVHVLGVTHDEAVLFPALDLEIWGHAHRDFGDMTPLRKPRPRSTRWQIATAHGHYDPVAARGNGPRAAWLIGDAEIAATGADYVALGHWNRAVRVGPRKAAAYYSGSPELVQSVNVVRLRSGGAIAVEQMRLAWDSPLPSDSSSDGAT